jgi:hypothetical protein
MKSLRKDLFHWKPSNKVETLFAFYTPHPGLPKEKGVTLTNDLSLFDHLNIVFLPESVCSEDVNEIIEIYNELVVITESADFNPTIEVSRRFYPEYNCFFLSS